MVVVFTPRLAILSVLSSHLVRSWFASDLSSDLKAELVQFRAEVTRAKSSLEQTTTVLEACNGYSSFLTWIIRLLGFSELLLLVWVILLLLKQKGGEQRHQLPAIQDSVNHTSSSESDSGPTVLSPVAALKPTRTGPLRPSDLKKTSAGRRHGGGSSA